MSTVSDTFDFYNSKWHSSGYLIQNSVLKALAQNHTLARSLDLFPEIVAEWHLGWQPEDENLEELLDSELSFGMPLFLKQPILNAISHATQTIDARIELIKADAARVDRINKELTAIAAEYGDTEPLTGCSIDEDLVEPILEALSLVYTLIAAYNHIFRERCLKELYNYTVSYSTLETTAFQLLELELRNSKVSERYIWACVQALCAQERKTVEQVSAEVSAALGCDDPFEKRPTRSLDYGESTVGLYYRWS